MPPKRLMAMRKVRRQINRAVRDAKVDAFRASRSAGDSGAETRRKVRRAENKATREAVMKYRPR